MNSFFRKIFFFTKSQKRGLVVLIAILLLVVAGNFLVPVFYYDNRPALNTDTAFVARAREYYNSLKPKGDKAYRHYSPSDFADNKQTETKKLQDNSHDIRLFEFDPNTIDSAGLIALGLKPFIVRNVINYRAKGGVFRSPSDFSRLYGLTDKEFEKLSPYIRIEEVARHTDDDPTAPPKDSLMVELNSADTTQLKQLKGIGSYFAQQIIYYRNRLGGYVSTAQLLEIKRLPPETYERIKSNISVDVSKIKKINVNWATAERLNRHPYLNFYQSKAIFELRKKGKLNSIDDLRQLKEFSDTDLERVATYLEFK